jgi:hypothetical protein
VHDESLVLSGQVQPCSCSVPGVYHMCSSQGCPHYRDRYSVTVTTTVTTGCHPLSLPCSTYRPSSRLYLLAPLMHSPGRSLCCFHDHLANLPLDDLANLPLRPPSCPHLCMPRAAMLEALAPRAPPPRMTIETRANASRPLWSWLKFVRLVCGALACPYPLCNRDSAAGV